MESNPPQRPRLPPALVIRILSYVYTAREASSHIPCMDIHRLFKKERGPLEVREYLSSFPKTPLKIIFSDNEVKAAEIVLALQDPDRCPLLKYFTVDHCKAPANYEMMLSFPRWNPENRKGMRLKSFSFNFAKLPANEFWSLIESLPYPESITQISELPNLNKSDLKELAKRMPNLSSVSGTANTLPEATEVFLRKIWPKQFLGLIREYTIKFDPSTKELEHLEFFGDDQALVCFLRSSEFPKLKSLNLFMIPFGKPTRFQETLEGLRLEKLTLYGQYLPGPVFSSTDSTLKELELIQVKVDERVTAAIEAMIEKETLRRLVLDVRDLDSERITRKILAHANHPCVYVFRMKQYKRPELKVILDTISRRSVRFFMYIVDNLERPSFNLEKYVKSIGVWVDETNERAMARGVQVYDLKDLKYYVPKSRLF